MKDSEARAVINLLTKRLDELRKQVDLLENPHPKDCQCDECEGKTPDHFCIQFTDNYALWWEGNKA